MSCTFIQNDPIGLTLLIASLQKTACSNLGFTRPLVTFAYGRIISPHPESPSKVPEQAVQSLALLPRNDAKVGTALWAFLAQDAAQIDLFPLSTPRTDLESFSLSPLSKMFFRFWRDPATQHALAGEKSAALAPVAVSNIPPPGPSFSFILATPPEGTFPMPLLLKVASW